MTYTHGYYDHNGKYQAEDWGPGTPPKGPSEAERIENAQKTTRYYARVWSLPLAEVHQRLWKGTAMEGHTPAE